MTFWKLKWIDPPERSFRAGTNDPPDQTGSIRRNERSGPERTIRRTEPNHASSHTTQTKHTHTTTTKHNNPVTRHSTTTTTSTKQTSSQQNPHQKTNKYYSTYKYVRRTLQHTHQTRILITRVHSPAHSRSTWVLLSSYFFLLPLQTLTQKYVFRHS